MELVRFRQVLQMLWNYQNPPMGSQAHYTRLIVAAVKWPGTGVIRHHCLNQLNLVILWFDKISVKDFLPDSSQHTYV